MPIDLHLFMLSLLYLMDLNAFPLCCRNVVQNYHKNGFFREQYDQRNGKGKGARVFNGWTSLVLLIMSEAYPS